MEKRGRRGEEKERWRGGEEVRRREGEEGRRRVKEQGTRGSGEVEERSRGGEEGRRGGEDRTTVHYRTRGGKVERKRDGEKRRIVQEEGEVRRKDKREER